MCGIVGVLRDQSREADSPHPTGAALTLPAYGGPPANLRGTVAQAELPFDIFGRRRRRGQIAVDYGSTARCAGGFVEIMLLAGPVFLFEA